MPQCLGPGSKPSPARRVIVSVGGGGGEVWITRGGMGLIVLCCCFSGPQRISTWQTQLRDATARGAWPRALGSNSKQNTGRPVLFVIWADAIFIICPVLFVGGLRLGREAPVWRAAASPSHGRGALGVVGYYAQPDPAVQERVQQSFIAAAAAEEAEAEAGAAPQATSAAWMMY